MSAVARTSERRRRRLIAARRQHVHPTIAGSGRLTPRRITRSRRELRCYDTNYDPPTRIRRDDRVGGLDKRRRGVPGLLNYATRLISGSKDQWTRRSGHFRLAPLSALLGKSSRIKTFLLVYHNGDFLLVRCVVEAFVVKICNTRQNIR